MKIGFSTWLLLTAVGLWAAACGPEDPAPLGLFEGTVQDFTSAVFAARIEIAPTGPRRIHLRLEYDPGLEPAPGPHFRQGDSDGALLDAVGRLHPDAGGQLELTGDFLSGVFYSAMGNPYYLEGWR
jgi:hypothetical protein